MTSPSQEFRLEPVTFADLKGWEEDDPSSLFRAMKDCRTHIRDVKPYRTGATGLTADDLLILLDAAEGKEPRNAAEARAFFEETARLFQSQRLKTGHDELELGRPPQPPTGGTKPRGSAQAVQELLIGQSWAKHRSGQKAEALRLGWRACLAGCWTTPTRSAGGTRGARSVALWARWR